MFYKKKELPEDGDIVLCTVKKVLSHSVFVTLDEHENIEGMIYISEVSPGRIRNIRDFVKEGKKIVCKVLKIKDSHHVDLSLRRVTTSVTINKNKEYKQEIKAEKMLELIGKQLKMSLEEMYNEVGYNAIEEYGTLNHFFNEVLMDNSIVKKMKISEKISKELIKNVNEKIKIPTVQISGDMTLRSYEPEGIILIKNILNKSVKKGVIINYLTAPKYRITVESENYKKAESIMKEITESISQEMKKSKGEFEFSRNE